MKILSTTSKLAGILTISAQSVSLSHANPNNILPNTHMRNFGPSRDSKVAKEELLTVNAKARYKNDNNEYIDGKIFLKIEHRRVTPESQNKLNGEMVGLYYFESNEETVDYGNGKKYKVYVNLTGDDGETLFDLTHKDLESKKFQLYGCNSTWTACSPELSEITFYKNGNIEMDINLPADKGVEVLQRYNQTDLDGNVRTIEYWTSSPRSVVISKN